MTPEQVDRMLVSYRSCTARAAYLKKQISIMRPQYERARAAMIEGDVLHAQNLDGMPHGSGVSNPVESLVLRYESGYQPRIIKDLHLDIAIAEDELQEMLMVTETIDGILQTLTEREEFVIRRHIIDAKTWNDVLDEYEGKFGPFGRDGLRKLAKRALAKLYEAAA